MWWRSLLIVALLPATALADSAAGSKLAASVLIVCNEQDADSRPLAEYYAARRGIPTNQICTLSVRNAETITRTEFTEKIREPILRFLIGNGLLQQVPHSVRDPVLGLVPTWVTTENRIHYIVLMRGVPLRIEPDPTIVEPSVTNSLAAQFHRNEASVETELALLPAPPLPLTGPLRNPFFGSKTNYAEAGLSRQLILVGRLDAPEPAIVRRMIDDAIDVERHGLCGRAYFDARGITEVGYRLGDDWLRRAERLFRQSGFECELDTREAVWDEDFPMTDVAVYAGWYAGGIAGPFSRTDFQFQPGAVACHIHSFSAASVRTKTGYWVGPLLTRGAAATMGNVYEPYLGLSPHLDVFFERLLSGWTFLEAAYSSQPALSWQTTFVGDPLYRPFAVTLAEQIQRLEMERNPAVVWAYVRQINQLAAQQQTAAARDLCRAKADALRSAVLYEKLGELSDPTDAIAAYHKAITATSDRWRRLRVLRKLAQTHEQARQKREALRVYETILDGYPTLKNRLELLTRARDLASEIGEPLKAQKYQAAINELTKPKEPPPTPKKR